MLVRVIVNIIKDKILHIVLPLQQLHFLLPGPELLVNLHLRFLQVFEIDF